MTGTTIGHYRVMEQLGGGGMGVVFKAEDLRLGRLVALKFLAEKLAGDAQAVERLEREARAASALNHPNICTIYDIDEHGGRRFIAMELLDGQPLSQRIGGRPLAVEELLELAIQAADALDAAHSRGIIHRDLKPANIFVTARGQAKLLDFGLAKQTEPGRAAAGLSEGATLSGNALTDPGSAVGTIAYMSPEQARCEELDARTDLFSFGALLYEMATGRQAFSAPSTALIYEAILNRVPEPASQIHAAVPPRLDEIVLRALEKDARLRYQTAADLLADLRRLKRDLESGRGSGVVPGRRATRSGVQSRASSKAGARSGSQPRSGSGVTRARAAKDTGALAVLPFENASGDPDLEYLSDGLTENLIQNLSQVPGLPVLARTTVFRFKGGGDPLDAARSLKAKTLLTGRVAQRGDTLLVSAELVEARSGAHLWGGQYQRRVADLFALQQDIATEITEKLQPRLSPAKKAVAGCGTPVSNDEAYQLYLRGRFYWNKWTAEGYHKAVEYYQKALQVDPRFALAYSGLADAYASLSSSEEMGLTPFERMARAKEYALRALELDDSLAEPHTSLAMIKLTFDWEWDVSEREFRRALELKPCSVNAHHWYSHLLAAHRRFDESLAVSRRALELDPLDIEMGVHLAWHHIMARQYDQAIAQCRTTMELDARFHETHWFLGWAQSMVGDYEGAIESLKLACEYSGNSLASQATLGEVYGRAGMTERAREILAMLQEQRTTQYASAYYFALIHNAVGETDAALDWLERGCAEHVSWMPYLGIDARLDGLRKEPRFVALMTRLSLPQ